MHGRRPGPTSPCVNEPAQAAADDRLGRPLAQSGPAGRSTQCWHWVHDSFRRAKGHSTATTTAAGLSAEISMDQDSIYSTQPSTVQSASDLIRTGAERGTAYRDRHSLPHARQSTYCALAARQVWVASRLHMDSTARLGSALRQGRRSARVQAARLAISLLYCDCAVLYCAIVLYSTV